MRRRGERFAAALSHTFSRENMAALFSARSFKEGGISAMSCVPVLGIAAGSVALVEALPSTYTAIDISRDQTTSISGDTAEHLSELDCDVEVYLVAEEGSEDEYVERMLDQYAQASDRVTVEQVDPALHPTFTDQYTSEDVADGSIIVVDDASNGLRMCAHDISEEGDPLEALCDFYFNVKTPMPRAFPTQERRFETYLKLFDEYRADGIVSARVTMCDLWAFEQYMLANLLRDKDIPSLELEVNYLMDSVGQVRTRVQAFVENLPRRNA